MTPITKKMFDAFDTRTKEHIKLVNDFAKMIGYDFPDHDHSKWDKDLVDGFVICNAIVNLGLKPDAEDMAIRYQSIVKHVKKEPHHPGYWDNWVTPQTYTLNPDGFKQKGVPKEKGIYHIIDARKMDQCSVAEMCADWCAVSAEMGGHPHDWAHENIEVKKRWLFTEEQRKFIYHAVDTMWTTYLQRNDQKRVSHQSIIQRGIAEALGNERKKGH